MAITLNEYLLAILILTSINIISPIISLIIVESIKKCCKVKSKPVLTRIIYKDPKLYHEDNISDYGYSDISV